MVGVEFRAAAAAIMGAEASTPWMWDVWWESVEVRTPSPQPRSRIVSMLLVGGGSKEGEGSTSGLGVEEGDDSCG